MTRPTTAVAALRHARRPGRDRGRAAGGARPARVDVRAARAGGDAAGRSGPRSPSCPTPPAGGSRCAGPSPNCWPTSTGTRTCCTGSGVRRGDAVALMAPNCAELITATLAAQLAGIAAPLNGALSPGAPRANCCGRSGARVLVTAGPELAAPTWETALALAGDGMLDAILVLRPTGGRGPARSRCRPSTGYASATSASWRPAWTRPASPATRPGSADLAALFHTGGTTGAPKLAAHTHATRSPTPGCWPPDRCSTPESVVFAALPLFHVNALVVTLLAPLFKGQQVVWAGPLGYRDPALYGEFWKMVEHYRIAAMSAVPTVYAALAQQPVDADISSLRLAVVGASPLPAAVRDRLPGPHRGVPDRGVRADRGDLRQRAQLPRRAAAGLGRPAAALPADEGGTGRSRRQLGRPARRPDRRAGDQRTTVFPGYVTGRDENGHVLDGLGKLVDGWLDTGDLAASTRTASSTSPAGPRTSSSAAATTSTPRSSRTRCSRIWQVTAAAAVGRPDVARRRGAGRLRHPRPRRHRDRGRAARLGRQAGAGPRCRAQGGDGPRRTAGHRRRQAVQAAAARRRHPPRARRALDGLDAGAPGTHRRSRAAPSWPPSGRLAGRRGRRHRPFWAATPSPGRSW